MATTFLQALKERYEAIQGGTDLPPMEEGGWVGLIPEGKANDFPNVVCLHGGERPTYQREPGDEDLADGEVVMEEGRAEFRVYATSLEVCEALAKVIKDGYTTRCLVLGGKDITLYRTQYKVEDSKRRGPKQEYVFQATVSYMAQFENA